MKISPVVQQAIDINQETQQTEVDIATEVLAKQMDSAKQQGQAIIKLIDQAARPSRGIDVHA